jgi:excisionase family DNA binding protein
MISKKDKSMETQYLESQLLLKADDVARILNISISFAYQLMNRNEIPTIHIGNARRVRISDLEVYIESNIRS